MPVNCMNTAAPFRSPMRGGGGRGRGRGGMRGGRSVIIQAHRHEGNIGLAIQPLDSFS